METICILGASQNLWAIPGQCHFKIEATKSLCPVYNSREKGISPVQMIDEKCNDHIQKFYAERKTALGTGHVSNQLGGCFNAPPPEYKQGSAVQISHIDLRYK